MFFRLYVVGGAVMVSSSIGSVSNFSKNSSTKNILSHSRLGAAIVARAILSVSLLLGAAHNARAEQPKRSQQKPSVYALPVKHENDSWNYTINWSAQNSKNVSLTVTDQKSGKVLLKRKKGLPPSGHLDVRLKSRKRYLITVGAAQGGKRVTKQLAVKPLKDVPSGLESRLATDSYDCAERTFNSSRSGVYTQQVGGSPVSSLEPNQEFYVHCDYGLVTGYITLEGTGTYNCGFTGWDNTTASFRCQAPSYPTSYSVSCRLSNAPTADNSCSSLDLAGTFNVGSSGGSSCVQRYFDSNASGLFNQAMGGSRISQLNANGEFFVRCNYGAYSGYITLDGQAGSCGFVGWDSYSAIFRCQALSSPGDYGVSCRMSNNPYSDNSCSSLDDAGRYQVATPLPPPSISVSSLGGNADQAGPYSLSADGTRDEGFRVVLGGSERRHVTRISVRNAVTGGWWDTLTGTSYWVVKAILDSNGSLLNGGDFRTVDFSLDGGNSITLYVPDAGNHQYNPDGSPVFVQLFFSDGTSASASTSILQSVIPPAAGLSFVSHNLDKVGPYWFNADNSNDGAVLFTLKQGGPVRVTNFDLRGSTGGIWNTTPYSYNWVLRVDNATTGAMLNRWDRSVDFTMNNGDAVLIYIPDSFANYIPNGSTLSLAVQLGDGSVLNTSTTVSYQTTRTPAPVSTNIDLDYRTIVNFSSGNANIAYPTQSMDAGAQVTRFDVLGNAVDAHDGQISQFGAYYLYGTTYDCGFEYLAKYTKPFCGFKSYSSPDLVHWTDQGLLFDPAPFQQMCADIGCFRPHIIYNAQTGKYVLWFNAAVSGNAYRVLTSDSPSGPFTNPVEPKNLSNPSWAGDFNLFADDNGVGYIVYTSYGENAFRMVVEQLDSTYTNGNPTLVQTKLADGGEAPALFKRGGKYYLVYNHGCAYCSAGDSITLTAPSIQGPWTSLGTLSGTSCGGQPTHVAPLAGRFLYMSDLWHQDRYDGYSSTSKTYFFNQARANYYWEELTFDGTGKPNPVTCGAQFTNNFALVPGRQYSVPGLDQSSGVAGFTTDCDIGESGGATQRLQSFRTSRSGSLREVTFTTFRSGTTGSGEVDSGLVVEIVPLDENGKPGDALFATTVSETTIGYSARKISVYPNIQVVAGQDYGIRLRAKLSTLSYGCYGFAHNDSDPYGSGASYLSRDYGQTFSVESGRDLKFEVIM